MRRALLLLLCLALLVFTGRPVSAQLNAASPTATASCCLKMKGAQNDCGRQFPKSKQEQACCAACVSGLAVIPERSLAAPAPRDRDQSFVAYAAEGRNRTERPPTPPPRSALV